MLTPIMLKNLLQYNIRNPIPIAEVRPPDNEIINTGLNNLPDNNPPKNTLIDTTIRDSLIPHHFKTNRVIILEKPNLNQGNGVGIIFSIVKSIEAIAMRSDIVTILFFMVVQSFLIPVGYAGENTIHLDMPSNSKLFPFIFMNTLLGMQIIISPLLLIGPICLHILWGQLAFCTHTFLFFI